MPGHYSRLISQLTGAAATASSELWGVTEIGHLSSCSLPTRFLKKHRQAAHFCGAGRQRAFSSHLKAASPFCRLKGQRNIFWSVSLLEWFEGEPERARNRLERHHTEVNATTLMLWGDIFITDRQFIVQMASVNTCLKGQIAVGWD